MKILVLLVLLAAAGMASGQEKKFYCGRHLAESLATLCYQDHQVKRSEPQWPWLLPEEAHAMQGTRNKRGVVDECCYKACALDELLSYC